MEHRTSGANDGGEVYSYRTIMETGSEEIKEILAIITGGYPPGIPIKEEKRHAD